MQRQASTAISDLVLALSGMWGFREVQSEDVDVDHRFGKWWFMLVTMAAALGVVRFGVLMPNHHATVERYHNNFSWLSRAIGIPCLAAEICSIAGYPTISQGFLISAVGTFIASSLRSQHKDRLTDLVGALAILSIIALSFAGGRTMLGVGGALVAAGGVAGQSGAGRWAGLSRVDILHYCLAGANVCIAKGIAE